MDERGRVPRVSPDELAETDLAPSSEETLEPLLAKLAAPPPAPLAAGDFVGRFEIARPLGRGGHGVVYEARDSELGRKVAVKVVRLDHPAGSLVALFKNEAESAARLNHPNIVTVHDFGTHHGSPYVILELLEGETLAQRLERGPVPLREALDIMIAVCRGLAHAHERAVIHRDIKPANIFLGAGGTVKVLDFGLAAFIGAMETVGERAAGAGQVAGTPAYMAPEQWRGAGQDERSDVFSAGVVLYQLVCGKLPFVVSSSQRSDLSGPDPDRARVQREALRTAPGPLATITLKALAPEPADRFASARALLAALEDVAHPRRRGAARWAAVAALIAIGAVVALRGRPTTPPAVENPVVAVLGFENLGHDPSQDWIGSALSEMLATELAAAGRLRLASGEDTARARRDLPRGVTSLSTATLGRLRSRLGADLVITGSYVSSDDGLRVDLRVQDSGSGAPVAALSQRGPKGDLVGLVVSLGRDLRAELRVSALSPAQADRVRASLPAGTEAARLYAAAKDRLLGRECVAARDLLEEALRADPRLALGHDALAGAWTCLGYEGRGRAEAKLAFDLSRELPARDRLWIEAHFWELSHDAAKALAAYRTLWALRPDDLEVGLKLVEAHSADAPLALAALRRLPAPIGDNPRIDLAAASAAVGIDDALTLMRRAEDKARASGNQALLATATIREAMAHHMKGDAADTEQAAVRAREIAVAIGDRGLLVDALAELGQAQLQQDQLAAASETLGEAVRLCGVLSYGRCAFPLYFAASASVMRGDLASARVQIEAYVAHVAERKWLLWMGYGGQFMAQLLLIEGDANAARRKHEESSALVAAGGGFPMPMMDYGYRYLAAQDEPAAAKAIVEKNLAVAARLGSDAFLSEALIAQTMLASRADRGDEAEAEALARRALAQITGLRGNTDVWQAQSRAVLAELLLSRGKLAEAKLEVARAGPTFERTESAPARLNGQTSVARVRAADGDAAGALKQLDAALAEAQRLGLGELAFEIRLAQGEIELAAGRSAAGRRTLADLARDARARGFLLIARLATRRP